MRFIIKTKKYKSISNFLLTLTTRKMLRLIIIFDIFKTRELKCESTRYERSLESSTTTGL